MEPIELSPGFNVVIGKNNSGKTAFTEALSLKFKDTPHRSVITMPETRTNLPSTSFVTANFIVQIDEARSILFNRQEVFNIPRRPNSTSEQDKTFLHSLLNQNEAEITFRLANRGVQHAFLMPYWEIKSKTGYSFRLSEPDGAPKIIDGSGWNTGNDIAHIIAQNFLPRIYTFRAERLNVGQSAMGTSQILNPDAGNLPQVLINIKAARYAVFERILKQLKIIFPEFYDINLVTIDKGTIVKIFLASYAHNGERSDLDIAMQDSGTGIGQVLAMLYVVNTAQYPQVFVIDEPQSFLHPDAIRKLFGILGKNYSEHQYIITTHSPTVLSSANPTTIIHLKKDGFETRATTVNARERTALGAVLADVGAKLSDVFGADHVLWVEGKTEELAFPQIVNELSNTSLLGTTILSVINKGDLEQKNKKDVDLALRMYQRLSQSPALIPPMLGFLFDREGLTHAEIEDIEKRLEGKISFLPRRMYENYLLNPEAIAKLISTLDNFSENPVSPEEVAKWIEDHKWDNVYYDSENDESARTEENYLLKVKGDLLLDRMFKDLSDNKHNYTDNKVEYGLILTEWLMGNAPEELQELADQIDGILQTRED
jgi:hypothetical protein